MFRSAADSDDLARDLAFAIERHQLHVHYQPIVDLATGAIREVEALARWEHPRWGTISPSEFIPLAECHELILDLGQWVLETACRQVKAWHQLAPQYAELIVNVNLSVKQLRQAALVDIVRRTLRETGLEPHYLHLEVTESLLLHEGAGNLAPLHALRDLGVTIAIDDFGTGYSALSYLRWVPASVLKLDQSFIRGLGTHERDTVIVRGIIAIAKALGLKVIGEGVETAAQCALLRALGCDRGQGYFFARPASPLDLTAQLQMTTRPSAPRLTAPANGTWDRRVPGPDPLDILVVDDDDHIRNLTSWVLKLEGYQVETAPHGTAALKQVKRRAPGVILLDMWMPVMDGWAFSQAYHELPGPHAPIVVLTANPSPGNCMAQVGAATYITKPFDIGLLLTTVSSIVASSRELTA